MNNNVDLTNKKEDSPISTKIGMPVDTLLSELSANSAPTIVQMSENNDASFSVQLRLFGRTDVGRVREHNEDNFLIADLTQNIRGLTENVRTHVVGPCGTVLAVCDGMGGAAAGEVASQIAVDTIYEQMQMGGVPGDHDELARRLVRAVEVAGLRIFAESKLDRNRRGMGTTATVAALLDDHLFLAQVGDSRGYLLRGDHLEQVTRDQSLVNQLVEAGQLTEEEAENFEHSNIILQALGTADSVQVDLTMIQIRQGDVLLLCSDGLSGMVRPDEIRRIVLTHSEPIDICKALTDRANESGGHDNITVIVAKFEGAPSLTPTDESPKYRKYIFTSEDTLNLRHSHAEAEAWSPFSSVSSLRILPNSNTLHDSTDTPPKGSPMPEKLDAIEPLDLKNDAKLTHTTSLDPITSDSELLRRAGVPSARKTTWLWATLFVVLGLAAILYVWLGSKLKH